MGFRSVVSKVAPELVRSKFRVRKLQRDWVAQGWGVPATPDVKFAVLKRHSRNMSTWVETGTWEGVTTAKLAKIAFHVHSIEPQPEFARRATERFRDVSNISIHEGSSEDCFEPIVSGLTGDVAFWLDGHFSDGGTYKGELDTPIVEELRVIASHEELMSSVAVFVDDFRCFDPSKEVFEDYPAREFLVEWAVSLGLEWTVEHDIFVAKSRQVSTS